MLKTMFVMLHAQEILFEILGRGEQDGIGVGGHGVQLSPHIRQEYIFRRKSACRTPAESRQEYMTRGKEYREPCKTL